MRNVAIDCQRKPNGNTRAERAATRSGVMATRLLTSINSHGTAVASQQGEPIKSERKNKSIRPSRHARQRLGMVPRLVHRQPKTQRPHRRPSRPQNRRIESHPRRRLGKRTGALPKRRTRARPVQRKRRGPWISRAAHSLASSDQPDAPVSSLLENRSVAFQAAIIGA